MQLHLAPKEWIQNLLSETEFTKIEYLLDTTLLKTFDDGFREPLEIEDVIDFHSDCNDLNKDDSLSAGSESYETDTSEEEEEDTPTNIIQDKNECQRTLTVRDIDTEEIIRVKIPDLWIVLHFLSRNCLYGIKAKEVYKKYEVSNDQFFEKIYDETYFHNSGRVFKEEQENSMTQESYPSLLDILRLTKESSTEELRSREVFIFHRGSIEEIEILDITSLIRLTE